MQTQTRQTNLIYMIAIYEKKHVETQCQKHESLLYVINLSLHYKNTKLLSILKFLVSNFKGLKVNGSLNSFQLLGQILIQKNAKWFCWKMSDI